MSGERPSPFLSVDLLWFSRFALLVLPRKHRFFVRIEFLCKAYTTFKMLLISLEKISNVIQFLQNQRCVLNKTKHLHTSSPRSRLKKKKKHITSSPRSSRHSSSRSLFCIPQTFFRAMAMDWYGLYKQHINQLIQ